MANSLLEIYRKNLAAQGVSDNRPDYLVMRDDLGPLAQSNPELFTQYPDFAREWADMREANAPSLMGEVGRAVKSGTQAMFSDLDSAAALAARSVGADKIGDIYAGRSKELGELAAQEAPTIPTVQDIAPGETGAGRVFSKDTVRYLAAKAGGAVPSLAEITALGLGGAALAGPAIGEAAAIGLGAFPMSAGAIYKETGRPDLAVGLGAVGAVAGAAPFIGLPARVIKSLFPRLAPEAAKAAADELVGKKAAELVAKLTRAGITEASGTVGMLGMEAANIVAKNIATGKDALTLESEDWNRLREAAIGGALASAPFAALSARSPEAPASAVAPTEIPSVVAPEAPAPVVAPEVAAPPATGRSAADIYRAVRAMAPEQQRARLDELSNNPSRTPEEEQEFSLLSATAPAASTPPQPPPVDTSITPTPVEAGPAVAGQEATMLPELAAPAAPEPTQAGNAAPATYVGFQPGSTTIPGFDIFNLTEDIPGHTKGSTVSRQTLEEAGFTVPPAPVADPNSGPIGTSLEPRNPQVAPDAVSPVLSEARQPPAPPNFETATAPEVDAWENAVRQFDKDTDIAVFGAERAAEYRKLQRTANGSNVARADAAIEKVLQMESTLSEGQQDILFGRNLPDTFVHPDDARELRATVAAIDSSNNVAELARASSKLIQAALRAASENKPLEGRPGELTARVMRRAEELKIDPKKLAKEVFAYRSKFEGDDVFELAGVTPEQFLKYVEGTEAPPEQALPAGEIKPVGEVPKPDEIPALVPSVETAAPAPATPEAAAVQIQSAPVPFEHGRVIVGEPSVDFRASEAVRSLAPEKLEELVRANMAQGTKGSKSGNRAETKIALAMEGPNGEVVVSGLVTPQKVLNERGFYDMNTLSLQRMGVREEGRRVIRDGGDSPAVLREAVKAGWKPVAILHFDAEPGKIFQRFDNVTQFDAAWRASEKSSGPKRELPKASAEVSRARRTEQDIQSEIDRLGAQIGTAKGEERDALTMRVVELYDELNNVIQNGQSQSGDVALRQAARDREELPLHAARAGQFQAVVSRLRNMGGKVDLFAKEFFQQGSADVIKAQITDLQGKMAQAPTDGLKAVIQRQIDQRTARLGELEHAQGVTFTPWHIAVSMDDVQQAHLGNLVTLLHEAAESLTQRMNPAVRGKVARAIDESVAELRETARAAAEETGVPIAHESGPADLLAETIAQKLAAEGIPETSSLAQTIIRWVKDLYYRVSMAAQRAFGVEPDGQTAVDWFENQLRREVFGDYDSRIGRMLDRFMPEPLKESTRRYEGQSETPGGVVDYLDPINRQLNQPWVEPTTLDALNWNVVFRQTGSGDEAIPDPEARARIDSAAVSEVNEFATELHKNIGNGVDWAKFWKIIGRGEDPKILLAAQEARAPGTAAARIGGERMTETMNGLASLHARILFEKLQLRAQRELAKARETSTEQADKLVTVASAVNKMEGDRRNADLHASTLREKAQEMVRQLVRDYRRGLDTAETHGALAEAVRNAEGLLETDPIPERYQDVFKSLLDGQVPIFDYIRGIADLDLNLADMTTSEVLDAIRDNADSSPALKSLSQNKPLSVALAVLARKNADQVDEIQLGWLRDAEKYRAIHEDLQQIRRATPDQLKKLMAKMDERSKAVGLRARIQEKYLLRRRQLRSAQERINRADERAALLESALPPIAAKVEELQRTGSTAPSEWVARDGAKWTEMVPSDSGTWTRKQRTLQFNPDGSAMDSDGVKLALARNMEWLRANEKKSGGKFYESVKRQTTELAMLDVQQKYHMGWTSTINRMVQPVSAEARQLGGAGPRIAQMLSQLGFITRSHRAEVLENARQWTHAFQLSEKAAGITDHGVFFEQVLDPVRYFLNTNPGLDEPAALRQAVRMARARLGKEPAPDFNERFTDLLRRDKFAGERMMALGEQYGSFIKDRRLVSEFRRAVSQGWLTTPRSIRGSLVMTIIRDMEKAGWKLEMKDQQTSKGETRRSVVRASTFDDLTLQDASADNTLALDQTLNRYFTPDIIQRWLVPFVNKGGEEIFRWRGDAIPQADVQDAWVNSGRSVLRFIDNMAARVKLGTGDEGGDPAAQFRLSILRQIDRLFGMESKLAYDVSQPRTLFDPMGPKAHVVMDARMNDLLPPEHVQFQSFDPKSSEILLGQLAFHGAFGRDGERIISALSQLHSSLSVKKQQYEGLTGTTKNARVAEAAARGWDYKELERAAQNAGRFAELQQKLEGLFGVNNPAGPFNDLRTGFEVLHTMTGQIVDNPKTGFYNILQLFERPFAQRSLGPLAIRDTAGAVKDFLKVGFGSMLETMNLHLYHASEYEKEIGSALGVGQRNLPWDVTVADIGQRGRFQRTNADKWLIKPLRMFRYAQQKGVRVGLPGGGEKEFPRFAPIPGLGVLNTIMQVASMAGSSRTAQRMELMVKRGIDYFATHRDDVQNPSFRFEAKDLGMGKLDSGIFDWYRRNTVEYGMGNLEDIVRDAMPRAAKGDRLLTKDQVLRLAQITADQIDGDASINTSPSILQNNKVLQMMMPLLRWPVWAIHHGNEGLNTVDGRRTLGSVLRGVGTLALWNLPVGIAFTFLMDQYDEQLLHKKSVLRAVDPIAAVPLIGPIAALAGGEKTIPENMLGFLDRESKANNIFGLGWDMASQFARPLDSSTGQRQFSLDQRVLVMSQFLNLQQTLRNLVGQDWTTTWGSFWRPFFQSLGGNGVLHAVDLTNNLLGLDNAEARTIMRINAANWLRAAGREADLELRPSGGGAEATATALGMWSREMFTAAMSNDRLAFLEAHQKALEAARKAVGDDPRVAVADREKEADNRVRQAWRARDPMDVFRFRPTPAQLAHIYSVMDDQGRGDVQQALARYQQFGQLINPSPAARQLTQGFNRMTQTPRLRMPSLTTGLFSR